ncbi:MAG: hypothetical protein WA919_23600 [Coleofasciculaceae cyanobacterium]
MSKIKIHDLRPTGADLFDDSESFLNELSNDELNQAVGGLVLSPVPTRPFPTVTRPFPTVTRPFSTVIGPVPTITGPWSPVIL